MNMRIKEVCPGCIVIKIKRSSLLCRVESSRVKPLIHTSATKSPETAGAHSHPNCRY